MAKPKNNANQGGGTQQPGASTTKGQTSKNLPGAAGQDYQFVKYQGRIYVVYLADISGQKLRLAWRVDSKDFDFYGVDQKKVQEVGQSYFKTLNQFGNASEVTAGMATLGDTSHPLKMYLKQLQDLYPNASWLANEDAIGVILSVHMEGGSFDEAVERLKNTKWYQNMTDAQRSWELKSKAEKQTAVDYTANEVQSLLNQYFGVVGWQDHVTLEQYQKWSKDIASGAWGDQQQGMTILGDKIRRIAEGIEGTQAWMDLATAKEDQKGFLNRPEDKFEEVRNEALRWLGPSGMPDRDTMWAWSKDLIAQTRSWADYMQFLRRQSKAFYPWLGNDEPWRDRAAGYRSAIQSEWGEEVSWDHDLLSELEGVGTDGKPTGAALSMSEFRRKIRRRPEYWSGDKAREEGYGLLSFLNETFTGAGAGA